MYVCDLLSKNPTSLNFFSLILWLLFNWAVWVRVWFTKIGLSQNLVFGCLCVTYVSKQILEICTISLDVIHEVVCTLY